MSRYGARPEPRPPGGGISKIDLHAHTTRSDGVLNPDELVVAAAASGIRTFALTDHDTLAGYRDVIDRLADLAPGLELITGVEINAVTQLTGSSQERELHILGFGMDPFDATFEEVLAGQRDRRRTRFGRTVDRLRDLGLAVDQQVADIDPAADDALGRPTLARALVAAGHAVSVEDAFARLLSAGQPGYVPRDGIGPIEAIAAIRAAGGVAVLAHFAEAPVRRDLLAELSGHGLRGLEVYYRRFDPATVAAVAAVALEMGLIATGGSDYHGDTESYDEAHQALVVPDEVAGGLRATLAGR